MTLFGGLILAPGHSFGVTTSLESASRLAPIGDLTYVPPTSIATVMDIYSRMTAPVRVAGKGPFRFIVDTGANQSVISGELAARLGLINRDDVAINGIAGVLLAPTTSASMDVAGSRTAGALLSVLPESSIGGVGLLGLDHLDRRRLTLDFKRQTLTIGPKAPSWLEGQDIIVRGNRRDGQLFLVDAELAAIRITAFIDSGAQNTIGNMALRSMAFSGKGQVSWTDIQLVSATGQTMPAEIASLPHLRIGGLKVPNWPVAFADLHTFKIWNLVDEPAILIGVDVLSRFETVCLDFERNEVRFRLPRSSGSIPSWN